MYNFPTSRHDRHLPWQLVGRTVCHYFQPYCSAFSPSHAFSPLSRPSVTSIHHVRPSRLSFRSVRLSVTSIRNSKKVRKFALFVCYCLHSNFVREWNGEMAGIHITLIFQLISFLLSIYNIYRFSIYLSKICISYFLSIYYNDVCLSVSLSISYR